MHRRPEVELIDTGEGLAERLARGGRTRAHDRMRAASTRAYLEARGRDIRRPPITSELEDAKDEGA